MRAIEFAASGVVLAVATWLCVRSRAAMKWRRRLHAYLRLSLARARRAIAAEFRREVSGPIVSLSSEQSRLKIQLASIEERQALDSRPFAPSPFPTLTVQSIDRLLRNPQGTAAHLLHMGDRQYRVRNPHWASAETLAFVLDAVDRGNRVLEGSECTVRIDVHGLVVQIVSLDGSPLDAAHCALHHSHAAGAHFAQLLHHLPDILARSPELIMGVLVPLAHLLSGAANSRKLAELQDSVRKVLLLWRCEQRATLEMTWLRASELIAGRPSAIVRAQLATYCDGLLKLRLELLGEMEFAFGIELQAMSGWRDVAKAKNLVERLLPSLHTLWELQLAVVADYFIRLATESTSGLKDLIFPTEIGRVSALVTRFEEHRTAVAAFPEQAEVLRAGGSALSAYREFLSNLIGSLEKFHAVPRLQSPRPA